MAIGKIPSDLHMGIKRVEHDRHPLSDGAYHYAISLKIAKFENSSMVKEYLEEVVLPRNVSSHCLSCQGMRLETYEEHETGNAVMRARCSFGACLKVEAETSLIPMMNFNHKEIDRTNTQYEPDLIDLMDDFASFA